MDQCPRCPRLLCRRIAPEKIRPTWRSGCATFQQSAMIFLSQITKINDFTTLHASPILYTSETGVGYTKNWHVFPITMYTRGRWGVILKI